jgi:glycosyltransferase involved in cell wall biosynthesis
MPFLLFAPFKIRRLIKKIKPDIVHAHYVTQYGFCGAFSGFHPLVVSAWGSDVLVEPHKSRILKLLVKLALKKTDLITCDAEHIKGPLVELGAEAQKIRLIYFGTDIKKFKPGEGREKIREELEVFDSPTVISLRTLEPIYNVESLIISAPLVLKEIPEAKCIIAGEGSEENRLKDLAKSCGILDNVKFVGLIPNNELPQYLSSMDVYVSTSLSDAGLSASSAEAMACGLPVVITDFGDNRKWVEDDVSGFIVPLKDPKALAEKIIYLLKNKDVRMKFGMRNRKIIEERNNYYKEMEKMGNIYIELVERYKT